MATITIGPPVRDDDFFDRKAQLAVLLDNGGLPGRRGTLSGELAFSADGISYATLFAIYATELGQKAEREGFDLLLEALQDDFYITMSGTDKTLRFHTKWLRDWWRRYHALGS